MTPASKQPATSGRERSILLDSLGVGIALVLLAVGVRSHSIPLVQQGAGTLTGQWVQRAGDAQLLLWLTLASPIGLLGTAGSGDIEGLIDGVERVADGDYAVDFEVDRDDELGALAAALDGMVEGVEDRETDLERRIEYDDDVFDAIDDVFYVLDREGEHRQWNAALAEVTGFDPEEIAAMGPLDYFEGEDEAAIAAGIEEAFENGHARVQADLQTTDGTIPYEWVANRLTAPDGTPVVAGIGRDISERVDRERELQATRDRLEATNDALQRLAEIGADREPALAEKIEAMLDLGRDHLDLSGGFVSRIDQEGDRFVLEHTAGMGGLGPDEVVTFSETFCRKTVESDEVLAIHDAPKQGLADDPAFERWGIRRYLGSRIHVEGELEGTVGFVDDEAGDEPFTEDQRTFVDLVTQWVAFELERRRKAERLQEYVEYTDDVLDSMDDVFYVVGPDMRMQRWNESLREATGYDDEEIVTMDPIDFVADEDEEIIADAVQETFETGSARAEARVRTKDGDAIPYEFLGSLLENPAGEPVLVGVGRDVTERVERERELQRTRYLLRQAQEIAHVGGWEFDLRTEPYEIEATDEFYRIHGLPPDADIGVDDLLDFYHPDDRDRIERLLSAAIEDGQSYDMEVRLSPAERGDRWIRAIAEPVIEDDEVVALRGSIQDITDRKEQELILESLHDVARGLLEAESRIEIADRVLDAATTVLDVSCIGVYLFDEDSGRLEPAAFSDAFQRACRDPRDGVDADRAPVLWDAYVSGEVREIDETNAGDAMVDTGDPHNGLIAPIGEHGVLLVASSTSDPIGEDDRRIAETLVASMETALHRLASEVALRDNQRQLEAQNRRLRRQIQITEIIRRVDRSLVGASSREEVESAVCERLVESDDVAFAWIGALDDTGETLVPRTWAGKGHEYLDEISLSTAVGTPDPAVAAAASSESTVVESVVEAVTSEPWRKHALVHDFSSAIAVPLELDEYRYGVLAVYGTEPGSFGELERSVFEELGESIANAINALEARKALYSDEFVELRLRFGVEEDFLGRVAAESGAAVEYVGLATHGDEASRLFFETSGVDPTTVRGVLDDLHAVQRYRQIGESEGSTLFEATVAGTVLAARLVSRGGVPRSMVTDDGTLEVVVDVPTTVDVREFVEMLRERYPSVELVARQDVSRDVETRQELVAGLFDGLTERQLEVLRTAFFAGFFEWPRESTGEEVADLLDVSQPTVNRHLRHALSRLLEQLFEEEPTALAEV